MVLTPVVWYENGAPPLQSYIKNTSKGSTTESRAQRWQTTGPHVQVVVYYILRRKEWR